MFEKLRSNVSSRREWACAVVASRQCARGRGYPTSVGAFGFDVLKRCTAFARDRRGISAVEFALLFPLMVALYVGSVQLSQGIGIYRDVSVTSSTVANLATQAPANAVTQIQTITNAAMSNILAASSAIIAPYSTAPLAVTVSGVKIDKNGNATIAWSDTAGGTARSVGQVVTLPTGLAVPNSFLVWGECQYAYTPPIGAAIMGTITLKDQIYMSPRISSTITRVNS